MYKKISFLLSRKVKGTKGSLCSNESLNAPILKLSSRMCSGGTPPSGKMQILNPCLIRSWA